MPVCEDLPWCLRKWGPWFPHSIRSCAVRIRGIMTGQAGLQGQTGVVYIPMNRTAHTHCSSPLRRGGEYLVSGSSYGLFAPAVGGPGRIERNVCSYRSTLAMSLISPPSDIKL